MDVTIWKQEHSMTVHLVNLTNPMMMKGPFRELIPISAEVTVSLPEGVQPKGVRLLVKNSQPELSTLNNELTVSVEDILDHEIIGIDLD